MAVPDTENRNHTQGVHREREVPNNTKFDYLLAICLLVISLVTFALLCVAMQNTLMQGLDGGMG